MGELDSRDDRDMQLIILYLAVFSDGCCCGVVGGEGTRTGTSVDPGDSGGAG